LVVDEISTSVTTSSFDVIATSGHRRCKYVVCTLYDVVADIESITYVAPTSV